MEENQGQGRPTIFNEKFFKAVQATLLAIAMVVGTDYGLKVLKQNQVDNWKRGCAVGAEVAFYSTQQEILGGIAAQTNPELLNKVCDQIYEATKEQK